MTTNPFYNEILTEHNVRPEFKHDLPDADLVLDGVNPSCGDEIQLKLKLDGASAHNLKKRFYAGCQPRHPSERLKCRRYH